MHYCLYAAFALGLVACSEKPTETSPLAASVARPGVAQAAGRPDTAVARQALTLAQLPAALRPPGRLLEAWRWADAAGENTLVVARVVTEAAGERHFAVNPNAWLPRPDSVPAPDTLWATDDAARAAHLLARQYVRRGGTYQQLWQLRDAVADCPLDLTLGPLPGSTCISDLDGNGRTETTLIYALGCRGGVDAAALKLIMHEGATKYALRGLAIQPLGGPPEAARARRRAAGPVCCTDNLPDVPARRLEGLYTTEKDFAGAPPAFLAFARRQWRRWRTRADQGTAVP